MSYSHKLAKMRYLCGIFVYFLMHTGHELNWLYNPKEMYILYRVGEHFVLFMAP